MLALSVSLGISLQGCTTASAPSAQPALENGFVSPPESARPRVWWHWMNGNVTVDGIDKDLDWMHKVGIGGVHNFDANLRTPQIVENRLVYMSPDWQNAFRHAVEKASAYDMEFGIASSAGWSETGGPWVKPKDGMKKVVWSEMIVKGGQSIDKPLPEFPKETGPFQTMGLTHLFGGPADTEKAPHASGEIGVFAVPLQYARLDEFRNVNIDGKQVDASALTDDDLSSSVSVTVDKDNRAIFQVAYQKPTTVRSARILIKGGRVPFRPEQFGTTLEVLKDGQWQAVKYFPLFDSTTTISFDAVTAKYFRVVMEPKAKISMADLLGAVEGAQTFPARPPAPTVDVLDFKLFAQPMVSESEVKAGFGTVHNYYDIANTSKDNGIDLSQVVDLSDKVSATGEINWVPPKGTEWKIIHLGWSLTGKTNHPATPEATGLEVDKYDADAVRDYLTTYLKKYEGVVGKEMMGEKGITTLLTDSLEIGASNWTPELLNEFQKRRGYDAKPWLPVLTGILVGTPEESDQFLYDYRTTLAELVADAHYSTIAKVAHEYDMKVYGESLEDQRPILGDDIAMRRWTDVPMAALWAYPRDGGKPRSGLLGDIRGASSASHFYGQNLVAAESMTSAFAPWAYAPADLKHVIDLEFAYGVNRPVIHTSVHQPSDDKKPGLSLALFGQHFNRHETWADMARPWVDYISRNAYMLQQGRYNADVAMFYGEETPVTTMFASGVPEDLPKHYAYDFVNTDMLSDLTLDDSNFVSPGGAHYRAIALYGTSEHMTLKTLKRLEKLAKQGGLIIGEKPVVSPSLNDDMSEFSQLVNEIWSLPNVVEESTDHLDQTLSGLGITHDVDTDSKVLENDKLMFVHRKLDNGDIYYINNRTNAPMNEQLSLRSTGFEPELWNPVDGSHTPVSYTVKGDQTVIDLQLKAEESLFVVLTKPTEAAKQTVAKPEVVETVNVSGPWEVTFEKGLELPESFTMDKLEPLEKSSNPKVKYFSGTVSYKTHFSAPANKAEGAVWLDLGKVGDVAQIFINGKEVSTLWYAPKRVDVSQYLTDKDNTLEVKVANLWVNRLIGDKQEGVRPLTWTAAPTFKPTAPLRASGLIGPVKMEIEE
ncbi:glycoside hydrolase [Vibrio sp. HA2012]|nr:glycoside hydrolase [Vibrio sp. HA2012]